MKAGQKSAKVKAWEEMGEWFVSKGAGKYLKYIKGLKDKDFADRYENLLEYFKPKLQRSEIKADIESQINPVIHIQVDGKEMNLSRDV